MIYRSDVNMIIIGSKKLEFLEFDKTYNPKLTDDRTITGLVYTDKIKLLINIDF